MNKATIVEELAKKYPGKTVMCLPEDVPTEIICEVDPTSDNEEKSLAIAIIDRSAPHYHKKATEQYTVLQGELSLFVDGERHDLQEGDTFSIHPGQIHYAIGNGTWVECHSEPGWIPEDHLRVEGEN